MRETLVRADGVSMPRQQVRHKVSGGSERGLHASRRLFGALVVGCALLAGPSVWAGPGVDLDIGIVLPGQAARFVVSGANPGERVIFVASLVGPGAGPCARGGSPCLGVLSPIIAGIRNADATGTATLDVVVPAAATQVWLQGIVFRGAASQLSPVRASTDPVSLTALQPGDLVVTEFMKDPAAVPDASGEWFEVYNALPVSVQLDGLTVRDDDGDAFDVAGDVVVPSQGYALFAANGATAVNGGLDVDYVYGTQMFLSNADDELVLEFGGVVLDAIAWDDGVTWPEAAGQSTSLDPASLDAVANDAGAAWCLATTPYGAGDLGTPGAANPSCSGGPQPCTTGEDRDQDGSLSCEDPDDTDPRIYPGAPERCDGLDGNGDGLIPAAEADLNGDGMPDCDPCAEAGYRSATQGLSGSALANALAALVQPQTCDDYQAARLTMFTLLSWESGFVEGVYTGVQVAVGDVEPNATIMNTEHTWPQSLGTSANPARCDLHHLYPVDAVTNSRRGNHLFGDVVRNVSWTGGGSSLGEDAFGDVVFEPRDVHKGNVARAMFYMSLRHGLTLDAHQRSAFEVWDVLDPVDPDELQRTLIIGELQGRPNPLVVCPDMLQRL